MDAWPRPPQPHPLAALDAAHSAVLRSNPLYTEEEEQEIIIIVDSIEEAAPEEPKDAAGRTPRRAPSTSSGYGSGGSGSGSHGRATPSPPHLPDIPKKFLGNEYAPNRSQKPIVLRLSEDPKVCRSGTESLRFSKDLRPITHGTSFAEQIRLKAQARFPANLTLKEKEPIVEDLIINREVTENLIASPNCPKELKISAVLDLEDDVRLAESTIEPIVLRISSSDEEQDDTLSKSLQEDIRACLDPSHSSNKLDDIQCVLSAALEGAGSVVTARARLHAALLALSPDSGAPRVAPIPRAPSLPYCGPGVRPGDVTMRSKSTDMSLLAASALFTLDAAKGELLARRLARGRRRRRRCRAVVAVGILALLLAAVGAAELLLSRGTRMFGVLLR